MINLASFDLNLLKVLDALLIEGSTTRAARRVGLSQPAVSAALGRLRHSLGDELFVREGQALRATAFAERLRGPVREILAGIERTLGPGDGFDPASSEAAFTLSGSDYFSVMLMPRLMDRLGRRAPNMRLTSVDLIHPGNLSEMGRFDVDIAFPCMTERPRGVLSEPLFWSDWKVAARRGNPRLSRHGLEPGQPLPIELYCDMGHVAFSPNGHQTGDEDRALSAVGRGRRVALTVSSFRSLYEAVAESDLLAILPSALAEHVAERYRLSLHPVPMPLDPALLWLAWNRWHDDDPAHRWLRGEIAAILKPLGDVDRPLPGETAAAAAE